MPRHFFLRLPTSNNFPIACVAAELANVSIGQALDAMPTSTKVDIDFAVATYNPTDEGVLPFSKKEGRNRAYGRLHSPFHRIRLCIENTPINFDKGGVPVPVMRAICKDILQGRWRELHPAAVAAHAAAKHWLDHDAHHPTPSASEVVGALVAAQIDAILQEPMTQAVAQVDPIVPARSEPTTQLWGLLDHDQLAIERMHNEGPAQEPRTSHPTAASVSRIEDVENGTANEIKRELTPETTDGIPAVEAITFHSAEELAEEGEGPTYVEALAAQQAVLEDAAQITGRCNCTGEWHDISSPGCCIQLEPVLIDSPEPEVTIDISLEDAEKLDRIFSHAEEESYT